MPRVVQMKAALIIAFGGAGALARYQLSITLPHKNFPYSIMIVNIIGAFLLGCVLTAEAGGKIDPVLATALAAGLLGGFTTFSTLAWDSFALIKQDRVVAATINGLGSLAAGVFAASLGYFFTSRIIR